MRLATLSLGLMMVTLGVTPAQAREAQPAGVMQLDGGICGGGVETWGPGGTTSGTYISQVNGQLCTGTRTATYARVYCNGIHITNVDIDVSYSACVVQGKSRTP
jgi:hypothetical protein